jgi:hypothetical protein
VRSYHWIFIRFGCYLFFFKNSFLLFITKFLVELGFVVSFLEPKRHSEQD